MPEIYRIDNIKYYRVEDLIHLNHTGLKQFGDDPYKFFKARFNGNYVYARWNGEEWKRSSAIGSLFVTVVVISKTRSEVNGSVCPPSFSMRKGFEQFREELNSIDVRGKRQYDSCYFDIKGAEIYFGMSCLDEIIKNDDSEYVNEIHYKYFRKGIRDSEVMWLTCEGLIRATSNYQPECLEDVKAWIEVIVKDDSESLMRLEKSCWVEGEGEWPEKEEASDDDNESDEESSDEDSESTEEEKTVTITKTVTETEEVIETKEAKKDICFEIKTKGMELTISIKHIN